MNKFPKIKKHNHIHIQNRMAQGNVSLNRTEKETCNNMEKNKINEESVNILLETYIGLLKLGKKSVKEMSKIGSTNLTKQRSL